MIQKIFSKQKVLMSGIWDKTPPKGDFIFLLLQKGTLGLFNLATKKWVWQVSVSKKLTVYHVSSLAETADFIWVHIDTCLMRLQKGDGQLIKKYVVNQINSIQPAGMANNVIVDIFKEEIERFQTIMINEKKQEWCADTDDYTTILSYTNGLLIRTESENKITIFEKGAHLWSYTFEGDYESFDGIRRKYSIRKIIVHNNLVIVGLEGYTAIAFDILNGTEVWRQKLDMDLLRNMALADGCIYLLDFQHYYILNPIDGSVKFHKNVREEMKAHEGMMIGELCVTQKFIICGTFAGKGRLLCIEKETGRVLESMEVGQKIPLNSPVYHLNNTVLFSGMNGQLYQVTLNS
jgi:outer membrane protein assembly factor BamB